MKLCMYHLALTKSESQNIEAEIIVVSSTNLDVFSSFFLFLLDSSQENKYSCVFPKTANEEIQSNTDAKERSVNHTPKTVNLHGRKLFFTQFLLLG